MNGFSYRLIVIFACFWGATVAEATQVLEKQTHEMVHEAAVVVMGTVKAVTSERVPGQKGRAQTRVSLSVERIYKRDTTGAPITRLTFLLPGGRLGRYTQMVPGTPVLDQGMEVLMILERHTTTGELLVSGFSQGCYVIRRQASVPVAVSDRRGVQLMKRDVKNQVVPARDAVLVERRILSELISEIKGLVQRKP